MTEMLSHGVTLMLADVEVLTDVTIVATSSTAARCTKVVITLTDSDTDAVQPITHADHRANTDTVREKERCRHRR
jgi:hypothetical protein